MFCIRYYILHTVHTDVLAHVQDMQNNAHVAHAMGDQGRENETAAVSLIRHSFGYRRMVHHSQPRPGLATLSVDVALHTANRRILHLQVATVCQMPA